MQQRSGPCRRCMQFAQQRHQRAHLVVGVQSARAGQNPDARALESHGLLAEGGLRRGEGEAVGAHAEEGDDAGPIALHLALQPPSSLYELRGVKLVSAGGGATDQVGEAISQLQKKILLPRPEAARREAAGVQRRPEAVAGAGEVVAGGGRVQPGIDAAEKDLQVRPDDVAQRLRARGLELLRGRLKLAGRCSRRTSRPDRA